MRRFDRSLIPLLVPLLLLPRSGLPAQEPLQVGDRVRVTAPDLADHPITGTLVALDSVSVAVKPARPPDQPAQVYPLAAVRSIQVARGKRSRAGRGALKGGVIGSAAGLALGIAAASEDGGYFSCEAGCVVGATVVVGAIGTGIGALIGAASSSTRWEEARLPQLSLVPAPGGFAVAVRFR